MFRIFLFIIVSLCFFSCTQSQSVKQTISVSIAPIAYLTEQITGDDFDVNILVPSGASPETYEPTPMQMKQVANSLMYINIGLIDFEKELSEAIAENMPDVEILRLDAGIDLITGEEPHEHHNGHTHGGTDPHIWNSPVSVKIMAASIYNKVHEMFPDSIKYTDNYNNLDKRIDSLDSELKEIFDGREISFLIYHPALSYLARDYYLEQIAIEDEGKEPSAEHIKRLINRSKAMNINKIFYQKQFSRSTVDALAAELGIEAVALDPLAYDIINNTLEISKSIAAQ